MTDIIQHLRELDKAATPGPWTGDRYDGTVKYSMLGGPDRACVCRGDNGNSEHGPYGFERGADESLVMTMRNALPDLLAVAEAARGVADLVRELHRVDDRLSPEYMSLIYAVDNLAKHTTNQGGAP